RRGVSLDQDPRGLERRLGPDPDAAEPGLRGRGEHAGEVHPVAEVIGTKPPEVAMNTIRIASIALAASAGLGAAGRGDRGPAAGRGGAAIRIGQVAPLTGGIAHRGKDNENGARLAIEEANAAKITIGGKPATFELVAEDDQEDPKVATSVAQKLVDAKVAG